MYFSNTAVVAVVSFWTLISQVQASQYANISTPISTSTPAVTPDLPTSTIVVLPIASSSISPNNTIQNTISTHETTLTTAVLPLPSSTTTLLNSTSLYIAPNATTIENSYNTSSTTLLHAFNTSTPTREYSNSTATQARWFTQHNTTQSSGPTPAPQILSPALPPSLNPHDPVILQPNRSVSLYFQAPAPSNGSEIPMAAVDIPKMAYPAVVLDHSALIADMECDLKKLRLKFLHRDALDVAQGSWTMPKFVMMAFHEKCGRASQSGERDYLLVHKLTFDHKDLSVSADISHIDVVEAVGKENPIKVDMGSYTPASVNGTAGFDSQNAQTVARNGTLTNTATSTDFDTSLDDAIGYTTLSSTSQAIKRFAGIDPAVHIVPRGWGFLGKVFKAVVSVAKKVVETFIPSWTLTPINQNIGIGLGGGNMMTPFGKNGYQLYSKYSGSNYIRLYCVDCGVSGVINVKATVTFNLIGLITSGSFSANGWLSGGLGLGVDANYATSIPAFSNTIVSIPLSPFAIPGLITIGPHLDLGVGASAGIVANGNMYAGLRLNWPAVHAQLNLYGAPSASGWIPSTTPEFQAHGTISMSASVFAQVSLGFGVSILNGLKSFGVALVEQPELYLGGTTRSPSCRGLSISPGFKNTLYADIFGSHYNIAVTDVPAPSTCIAMNLKKRNGLPTLPAPAHVEKRGEVRQIKTSDGAIGIHYTDNGNLFALPHENGSSVDMSTISFSATKDGILTGDVEGRIFHGYVDTLGSIGVSRLRLSRTDHIPKTAVAITLQRSKNTENPDSLVALDAAHNVYYPIVCTFGDKGFPKWFLAKDPDTGSKVLMDEDNVDDITGLKVDVCAYLPFISV